jgi:hypothetical protein
MEPPLQHALRLLSLGHEPAGAREHARGDEPAGFPAARPGGRYEGPGPGLRPGGAGAGVDRAIRGGSHRGHQGGVADRDGSGARRTGPAARQRRVEAWRLHRARPAVRRLPGGLFHRGLLPCPRSRQGAVREGMLSALTAGSEAGGCRRLHEAERGPSQVVCRPAGLHDQELGRRAICRPRRVHRLSRAPRSRGARGRGHLLAHRAERPARAASDAEVPRRRAPAASPAAQPRALGARRCLPD